MRTTLVYVLLLVALTTAKPGDDVMPKSCRTVSYQPGMRGVEVCSTIREGDPCGLELEVEADGRSIVKENFDQTVGAEIVAPFSMSGYSCYLTATLHEQPGNKLCLTGFPTCEGIPMTRVDIGCFDKSRLDTVKPCHENNHMNNDPKHFDQCFETIPEYTDPLCTKVVFNSDDCTADLTVYANSTYDGHQQLYESKFPITQLKGRLGDERNCLVEDLSGCEACINWTNLTLSEDVAEGCGHARLTCSGQIHYSYDLGCFKQDGLSKCLHGCPNMCNGRGTCEKGKCLCIDGYSGLDCTTPPPTSHCKIACDTRHATCQGDLCMCDDGYTGADCSQQKQETHSQTSTQDDQNDQGGSNHAAIIGVGVAFGILILAGAAFVGVYIYHKRKNAQPQFTRLDLIDDNDTDDI